MTQIGNNESSGDGFNPRGLEWHFLYCHPVWRRPIDRSECHSAEPMRRRLNDQM